MTDTTKTTDRTALETLLETTLDALDTAEALLEEAVEQDLPTEDGEPTQRVRDLTDVTEALWQATTALEAALRA